MSSWGGRKVRRLIALTLANKGDICHLCGMGGADSADHDPPRRELVERGVVDPDDLGYLWPCHRVPCNVARQDRPVTAALRAELRRRRIAALGRGPARDLSPRFADRRPVLPASASTLAGAPSPLPPRPPGKTGPAPDRTRP